MCEQAGRRYPKTRRDGDEMQQSYFDRMLDEIYGAFGRQRPTFGSPAYKTLWRRMVEEKGVPDEAAKHIAYAISEYDSLPMNLGKAMLREFENWLSDNPGKRAALCCCHECSTDVPGFFWAWDEAGRRMLCKCACNQRQEFTKLQAWTRGRAVRAGLALTDPQAAVTKAQNVYTRAIGKQPEAPRPDHVREVAYADAENW